MAGPGIALTACLLATAAHAQVAQTRPSAPAPHAQDASLEEYRKHLATLETLTQTCAKKRDKASCDPQRVGADDRVALPAEKRLVRYGWLRVLLEQAQKPDEKPDAAKKSLQVGGATLPSPKTTTQLLAEARKRLAEDAAQASAAPRTAQTHTAENKAMREVLARREFANIRTISSRESAYERILDWLNRLLNGVGHMLSGAAWVAQAIFWGFLLAVAVGLVWGLLQLERRWRIRLVSGTGQPAPTAASARDWQLWMEDARQAAQAGLWREAIHFLYWAAISRLESKRLWPADRARTPREYLALVAPDDPRKPGLAALTKSFEHVWYGGRAANESDYRQADTLVNALIEGGETR